VITPPPPDVIEIAIDPRQEGPHMIHLSGTGHRVLLLGVTPNSVEFTTC
jgi:hypothetical protein